MNKNQRTKCDRCCCKKFKSADETCWMFPSVVELFLSNIYYTPSKPVLRALLSHRGGRRERVSSFTIPPPAKTGNRLFPLPSLFFFEHNSNSTSGLILPSFLFSLPGTLPPSFFFFFFFLFSFLLSAGRVGWPWSGGDVGEGSLALRSRRQQTQGQPLATPAPFLNLHFLFRRRKFIK